MRLAERQAGAPSMIPCHPAELDASPEFFCRSCADPWM